MRGSARCRRRPVHGRCGGCRPRRADGGPATRRPGRAGGDRRGPARNLVAYSTRSVTPRPGARIGTIRWHPQRRADHRPRDPYRPHPGRPPRRGGVHQPARSGHVRAAALLAEIGDARGRYPTDDALAAAAGISLSTRASGRSHHAVFRRGCNHPPAPRTGRRRQPSCQPLGPGRRLRPGPSSRAQPRPRRPGSGPRLAPHHLALLDRPHPLPTRTRHPALTALSSGASWRPTALHLMQQPSIAGV
ncbi:transposase [Pseudonocardia charpentierae]|uniref:Transposase n=1 Tax=Pseudonocardia charpentierae TaxID=3075545 RepID=A0ABU2NLX6_9PSEU|nr:transposase [Pseudonocardia sp. DSM 45834]MDT0353634.1 transposase [Pseudonocardia sp. DSM 45834]